jgi:hypothetical protein
MTASRVFIVALILAAILFVVGVGIGFHQNEGQPEPRDYSPPGWAIMLSDWLSPGLDLKVLVPLAGSCGQPSRSTFTLAAGAHCILQVPSAKQNYRKLKLHLVTGKFVRVVYTAPPGTDGNLSTQQLAWPGKDPQSLLALAAGGTLSLTCSSGPPCQLQAE